MRPASWEDLPLFSGRSYHYFDDFGWVYACAYSALADEYCALHLAVVPLRCDQGSAPLLPLQQRETLDLGTVDAMIHLVPFEAFQPRLEPDVASYLWV